MDNNAVYQPGRDDLAAIVAGIERDDTTGVKAMLGGMSPEELTRLDLAAATDHAEHLEAFQHHLNTYQTVDILIVLERHERAARAKRN